MDQNISIIKVLLLFYVLTSNSLLQPLLSKQWNTMVQNNRLIQHIIGFTTMMTLVALVSENNTNYLNIMAYSLVGYLWFIFSTKMDIHWNIIIMIILLVAYLHENSLKTKNNSIEKDRILTNEEKELIKMENNKKNMWVAGSVMGVILLGMFMYSNKKEIQYGGGYNIVNFLLY